MEGKEFYQRHPKLKKLDARYHCAFLVLYRCMPPRPAYISKDDLNQSAMRASESWKRISKSTRSERIMVLIGHGLFLPDPIAPRFVCGTERGDEFYAVLLETPEKGENKNRSEKKGQAELSEAPGDSSPA